jgi:hypothetical protein
MPWRVTIKVNSVGRSYVGHRTESAVATYKDISIVSVKTFPQHG